MFTFRLDERTYLRLPEESDAEELYAVIVANRAYLSRWMPWAIHQTPEGTIDFIRLSRRQFAENRGLTALVVQDDRIIGTLGLNEINAENSSAFIGYWLAEHAQGRGTMTLAVRGLIEHAFRRLDLNRIEIHAGVENKRSRAIPERLGFTQEGVLREAERVGDRFVDHVVYGMLASEWAQTASGSGSALGQLDAGRW